MRCTLAIALGIAALGGCYSPSFRDCEVRCAAGACPDGLTCVAGVCRGPGETGACPPPGDDGGVTPDAGICAELITECASRDVLRTCEVVGEMATDVTCPIGCSDDTGTAHCRAIVPTGGAVTDADLALDPELAAVVLDERTTFNTETGTIGPGVRPAGAGILNGIGFEVRQGVGVFRFHALRIGPITAPIVNVVGENALALVAVTTVELNEVIINLQACTDLPAAGRGAGGVGGANGGVGGTGGGTGGGGGTGSTSGCGGGGGGGLGGLGGLGGMGGNVPGGSRGTADPSERLVGGGGGGGGGSCGSLPGGQGGNGGGAIQIVANQLVRIFGTTTPPLPFEVHGILASGCGGAGGNAAAPRAGGGGGAGGTILIESSAVQLDTVMLAANGGGGGGREASGANGRFDLGVAQGGGPNGGNGSGVSPDGDAGGNVSMGAAGGGGGAAGRIRINTADGTVVIVSAGSSPAHVAGVATIR